MRFYLTAASVAFASSAVFFASSVEARQKVSLQQAEEICLVRAKKFARSSFGRDSGFPPPDIIDHRYRICVHSKSGRNPARKLQVRGMKLTLVGRR